MGRKYLVIDERGKKYLVERPSTLETDLGVFEIDGAARPGDALRSHLGRRALMLNPTLRDYVERMPRVTRIPHFEDIGYVLAFSGLRDGQTVLDAGTGSGCCALYFSQAVGPSGKVISFETRKDAYDVSLRNIRGFGCQNVQLVNSDFGQKEEELKGDLVFLDLGNPSRFLELAVSSLNPGGTIAIYVPFLEEGALCLREIKRLGCGESRMTEIQRRDYESLPAGTRPRTTQTVHTGYLVLGRSPITWGSSDD